MPVVKRPANPLRAAILRTANRVDAPTQDRSPMEAQLRGFLAGILGGPVADTVAPEAEDAMMQAAMPAMAFMPGGRNIHPLLRNHSPEQLQRMIDQGYDVENVMFRGSPHGDERAWQTRDIGLYHTNTPQEAGAYGDVIYPVVTRGREAQTFSPPSQSAFGKFDEDRLAEKATVQGFPHSNYVPKNKPFALDDAQDKISIAGRNSADYDTASMLNKVPAWEGQSIHQVVKDPKNIRSIFANFDPNKMELRDLLASILGLGTASTLLPRKDP